MTTRLRRAIDAMCKNCCYDDRSRLDTWRQQVEACGCRDCPLYPVRPKVYRSKAAFADRSEGTRYLTPTPAVQAPKCGLEGPTVGQNRVCLEVGHG